MASNINQTLADLEAAISALASGMGDCCKSKGQTIDDPPSEEQPQFGRPGDQFPDAESYYDARCNAANGVFDTVLAFVNWLDVNKTDVLAGVFGGIMSGLTVGMNESDPAGDLLVTVSGILVTIGGWVLGLVVDYSSIITALGVEHTDLVKALYNASTAQAGRDAFLNVLDGGVTPLTATDLAFIEIVMPFVLVNEVYSLTSRLSAYQSGSPVDCGGVPLTVWTFAASGQGWTFVDESTGPQQAAGLWVLAKEAWEIELTLVADGGSHGQGTIWLDGLSIAVDVGNSVQLDYSATSDGLNSFQHMTVIFTDLTQQTAWTSGSSSSAGTLILSIAAAKTIEEIRVFASREAVPSNYTIDFEEIRVQ